MEKLPSNQWMLNEPIGLRELAVESWRRRWSILIIVLVFLAIAALVAFLTTPVYQAKVLLVPASADRNSVSGSLTSALGQIGGLASLAGVALGGKDSETEEAIAVLKSREFTQAFISQNNLMPALTATIKNRWFGGDATITVGRAFRYFDKKIRSIDQDKKTGLVTLQINWIDRESAAEWANYLVGMVNDEMRSRAIKQADSSLGFLEKELQTTSTIETRQAISKLIEVQVKQRMLANVTKEYVFRVVDKALPPDPDDPIKPRKLLLLVGGPTIGLFVSIIWVLMTLPERNASKPESSAA